MAWGALPVVSKLGIFAPLIGFISGLFSRVLTWLFALHLTGAIYRVGVAFTFLAVMFTATFSLVMFVNSAITDVYNNGGAMTQTLIAGIASFLPTYTPVYVSIILTYYTASITLFITVEVVKFKRRVAYEATKSFTA